MHGIDENVPQSLLHFDFISIAIVKKNKRFSIDDLLFYVYFPYHFITKFMLQFNPNIYVLRLTSGSKPDRRPCIIPLASSSLFISLTEDPHSPAYTPKSSLPLSPARIATILRSFIYADEDCCHLSPLSNTPTRVAAYRRRLSRFRTSLTKKTYAVEFN